MGKESLSLLFGHKLELRLERIQNKMTTPGTDGKRHAELNFGHTGFSVARRKSAIAAFGRSIFHSNLRFNYKKKEKTKNRPRPAERNKLPKKRQKIQPAEKNKKPRGSFAGEERKSHVELKNTFSAVTKNDGIKPGSPQNVCFVGYKTGVPAESIFGGV